LVAIAGAIAVLASVIPHVPDRQLGNAFYRVPVGLMSVALIVLIAGAFRLNRRALLLAAAGLALGEPYKLAVHASCPRRHRSANRHRVSLRPA